MTYTVTASASERHRLERQRQNLWDAAAAIIAVARDESRVLTRFEQNDFCFLMQALQRMDEETKPQEGIALVFNIDRRGTP